MRRVGVLGVLAGCALTVASACSAQHGGGPVAATLRTPGSAATVTATSGAAVSSTAGAAGGAASAAGGSPGAASNPVPWVADVASAYVAPVSTPPPAPLPEYETCVASQLSGRIGSSSQGAGNVYTYFILTNTSARSCTISSGPSGATAFGTDGTQLTLSTGDMNGFGSLAGPPVNLKPGQTAQAVADSAPGGICSSDSDHFYTLDALAIGVGGTGTIRVSLPQGQPLTLSYCGTTVPVLLGFGAQAVSYTTPSQPLDVLKVSRSMPATVTAGTTADYTVTLTNPTSGPVALSPCPSYAEFMVASGGNPSAATHYYYYLNCQAAPEIPGYGSVTFAMEVPVPRGAGSAKYGWQLQDTSLETGGVTTVTAG